MEVVFGRVIHDSSRLIEWSFQISTSLAAIDHLNTHDKNVRRARTDVSVGTYAAHAGLAGMRRVDATT